MKQTILMKKVLLAKKIILVNRVILLLGMAALLSGCWDRLEIEDRALLLGMSIDSIPQEHVDEGVTEIEGRGVEAPRQAMVKLTVQIAIPGRITLGPDTGSSGSSGERPIWVTTVSGQTIDDAMMNLQQQLDDRIFLGHLRVIVISESIARRGLGNLNDFLRRSPQVRRTAWLIVAKDKASRFMTFDPQLEPVPTIYMINMMDHFVQLGRFPSDTLGIFWSHRSMQGKDPVLPYIDTVGSGNIKLVGMAVFSGNKMVDYIKPMDIGLYMSITGNKKGGYAVFVNVPDTQSFAMFHTTSRKMKTKVDIRNGIPHVTIHMTLEGTVAEKSRNNFKLDNQEDIRALEEVLENLQLKGFRRLVEETQKWHTDIFGFGEYVRAKHPFYWKNHVMDSKEWHRLYGDVQVDFKLEVNIRRVGNKSV